MRAVRAKLEAFVASPVSTRPIPCADCSLCRWAEHCDAVLTSQDSLFQVANVTRGQVKKLEASGIETMAALARHDGPVRGVASATAEKLVGQARLQHARKTGEPAFELRPAQPGKGFDLLLGRRRAISSTTSRATPIMREALNICTAFGPMIVSMPSGRMTMPPKRKRSNGCLRFS
jgi:hypothetical protein